MASPSKSSVASALADAIERGQLARRAKAGTELSLRSFVESSDFCGLPLSPAMAAILDASDGNPVTTVSVDLCRQIFGCAPDRLPREKARVVGISAGGRGGKTSRGLAPAAVYAAWTTPLRVPGAPADMRFPLAQEMARGERPAAIIVAPRGKLAKQAYSMIRGIIEGSPVLRVAIVGEPTGESLTLRRPDGILVDIMIVAADKGGASVRSKSLVFLGMDEVCFFSGDGYAVNDEDIFSAGIQRVVPYGQAWAVSTPWIEGDGLLERLIASDFGRHENALIAARVGTRTLNPNWDPDGSIERMERARPGGAENADREILAIPLPKGSRSFFDHAAIKAALARYAPVATPEEKGAGCDFGHAAERDSSALAFADRYPGGIFAVPETLEIPSAVGQKPSSTYRAFAARMVARKVLSFGADVHYKEAVKEVMDEIGIQFVDVTSKDIQYAGAKSVLHEGRLCLADLPDVERGALAEQLRAIVAQPLTGGKFKILAPRKRASDMMLGQSAGGHCDTVSALVAALWRVGSTQPALWAHVKPEPKTEPREHENQYRALDYDDLRWRD